MTRLRGRLSTILLLAALLISFSGLAYAQGGSSRLVGTIVDSSGAFIPGADIVAKDNATATEYHAVSDATGRYEIPAIGAGTYTVTVSLMGFKTVILPDIQVISGHAGGRQGRRPRGGQPLGVHHGDRRDRARADADVRGHDDADDAADLAGAAHDAQHARLRHDAAGRELRRRRPATRRSWACREARLNITIDGLNVQDQALKSSTGSAFFAYINPRLDAVEEVTVSTANPGAESSGQGAVQVRFQTRSGTNKFQGSIYHYMRRTQWNTNYWFNQNQSSPSLPNDKARIDTFGGRLGGPIIRDRAFFFLNYEEFRQPQSVSRTRTVLTPDSLAGRMVYAGGPAGGVNMLSLAAANGQTSTYDPSIKQILDDINATLSGQSITAGSNSITNTLTFQPTSTGRRIYPTGRLDVNVTREQPRGRVVLPPAVHLQAGHAEQPRRCLPRLQVAGRSDVVAPVADVQLAHGAQR